MLYAQNKAETLLLLVMPLAPGTDLTTDSADICPWFLDPSGLAPSKEVDGVGPVGDGTIDYMDSLGGQGRSPFTTMWRASEVLTLRSFVTYTTLARKKSRSSRRKTVPRFLKSSPA